MSKRIIDVVLPVLILIGPACDEAAEALAAPAAEEAFEEEVSARAGGCATLYEHWHFEGEAKEVDAGAYVSYIGSLWNDIVSSVKVQPGCVLNVFEHADFAGAQTSYQGSVPFVGEWWNDKISAYTCDC